MDMYFGLGGELLTPLDEMLDVDIKLSLELDLELKDPLCGLGGGVDDWGGWGSLGTSPSLDVFGEKEACVMVSPESVMPFIKREIKQEPPPRFSPIKLEEEEEETSHSFEQDQYDRVEVDEDNVNDDDIEEEEEEDDDDEEDEDEEEEEEDDEEEEIKIQPKERNLWNSILTKPTVTKSENIGVSYQARPKTEVSKPAHLQNVRILHQASKSRNTTDSSNSRSVLVKRIKDNHDGYPKPAYSYSCLIAMALKNSMTGSLPVSEIYNFMCEHFPYFKSAPAGWKNSVRHNLSLNKCFEKIEKGGAGGGCRKGCLWAMNPAKISKMDDEVAKWSKKDPAAIRRSMKYPEELEKLEKGDLKIGVLRRDSYDSGAEAESSSDSETEEVPPSLKRFDSRLSSQESNDLGLPDEMYEELGLLEEVMSSDTDGEPGPQVKRVRLGLEHYPRHSVRPV